MRLGREALRAALGLVGIVHENGVPEIERYNSDSRHCTSLENSKNNETEEYCNKSTLDGCRAARSRRSVGKENGAR